MFNSTIKKVFYQIFKGVAFPAWNSQLKGVKLIIDPMMPNFHFWRDVEIEGHFVYDNFIKDGNVIFDIGGNVGLHSAYFATKFRDTKVFTFEPLPENVTYLKKLITLNKLSNIQLIEKAVGGTSGTVYFDRDKNNHQGHITNQVSDLSVQVTSLDDFITKNNVLPNFIKIDVEGFEGDVLDGFHQKVADSNPFVIIEIHGTEQGRRVATFFRTRSYTMFRLTDRKEWDQYKQLVYLENESDNPEIPNQFWGVVLAIPDALKEQYKHLCNRIA